jgi:hypothetical protein
MESYSAFTFILFDFLPLLCMLFICVCKELLFVAVTIMFGRVVRLLPTTMDPIPATTMGP